MAAVGEDRELHACRPAVFEQRIDRGADRATGVENVVDEDHRAPFELEVELRVPDDRLGPPRWLAVTHVDVVAVEGDVELPEVELDPGPLLDQVPQALRERHPTRVDADESDRLEIVVTLDHLMGDPRECAADGFSVEQNAPGRRYGMLLHRAPFRPRWTELKGGT